MKLQFTNRLQESGNVWSYFFEPVNKAHWRAGQSIRIELPRATWGIDERRFTISSAPHEAHIRITTRLSDSEFKKNLHHLQRGAYVLGHNIEGSFIWQDDDRPKLYIASGVGITPFRSMLLHAQHVGGIIDATLVHFTPDVPAVFADELRSVKGLQLIHLQQRAAIEQIIDTIPTWRDYQVYISGSSRDRKSVV